MHNKNNICGKVKISYNLEQSGVLLYSTSTALPKSLACAGAEATPLLYGHVVIQDVECLRSIGHNQLPLGQQIIASIASDRGHSGSDKSARVLRLTLLGVSMVRTTGHKGPTMGMVCRFFCLEGYTDNSF
jgi:hypothetical protein